MATATLEAGRATGYDPVGGADALVSLLPATLATTDCIDAALLGRLQADARPLLSAKPHDPSAWIDELLLLARAGSRGAHVAAKDPAVGDTTGAAATARPAYRCSDSTLGPAGAAG